MLKKTLLTLLAGLGLAAPASAVIDLSLFDSDFNRLLNGVAQDVAPTLRLGALSGDLQGDATIDHATFSLPGFGLVASNGLGRVLRPGATDWDFDILPLSKLINDNAPSSLFERLMAYPSLKFAAGFGWNRWDFTASGMWFPDAIAPSLAQFAGKVGKTDPKFSFGNIGFQVRRTFIEDSGWTVPAVSLGTGLYFTGFNLALKLKSLDQLGVEAPELEPGKTFDMGGDFGITTSSTVFTVDLHVSKHFVFLTPYLKFSGAYQNSTFRGNADLEAIVMNGSTVEDTIQISSHPVVNVSDFAFLTTTGLEINLFVCQINFNVVSDVSRALWNVKSFALDGINADAISVNTGVRWSF